MSRKARLLRWLRTRPPDPQPQDIHRAWTGLLFWLLLILAGAGARTLIQDFF